MSASSTPSKPAKVTVSTPEDVARESATPARPEKRIAIVGFTASRDQAPWGDPDWEIWICNNLWKIVPDKWHRLYDLHDLALIHT